jgi:hypothetical protein
MLFFGVLGVRLEAKEGVRYEGLIATAFNVTQMLSTSHRYDTNHPEKYSS